MQSGRHRLENRDGARQTAVQVMLTFLCLPFFSPTQIHMPTLTCYSNWPTQRTPLGYVSSMCFSPHSGMLAMGNDKGRALLYRVNHYPSS